MSFDRKQAGRTTGYSYQSVRIDGRVVKRYVGNGAEAERLAQQVDFTLDVGEPLLVFSDGVPEAGTDRGSAFGNEQVEQVVTRLGPAAPRTLVETLAQAVKDHTGDGPADYDIAILAVRRTA